MKPALLHRTGGDATQTLLTNDGTQDFVVKPVPLPAAAWLLLSGLAGLGFVGDGGTFTDGETYSGVRAATRWQAFSRTRIDVDAWWEKRRLSQGDLGLLELTLALVRNLTPQVEARLAASWSEQNANTATLPEFKAGSAFLGIVWRR